MTMWKLLMKELYCRLHEPLKQPAYVFYFVGVVCLVGLSVIWIDLIMPPCNIFFANETSAVVFSALAILSAGAADLTLKLNPYDNYNFQLGEDAEHPDENLNEKLTLVLRTFGILFIIIGIILATISVVTNSSMAKWLLVIISLLLWWISNADREDLGHPNDSASPHESALGFEHGKQGISAMNEHFGVGDNE
jgi:hypothetical protein